MKLVNRFLFFFLLLTGSAASAQNAEKFLGQWSFNIENGFVGWLQVTQNDGFLDAELLWKWGSVTPVAHVYLTADNTLIVTRTSNQERTKKANGENDRIHVVTSEFKFKTDGKMLTGVCIEPNINGLGVKETILNGTKLPEIVEAPDLSKLEYGKPVQLFNGKDLTGWKLINPAQANGFRAENGTLVNNPVQPKDGKHISYGNIRTEQEFEDFNLKLEVNVPSHSNSGIYLRGIYEIQVFDSYGKELDSHNMGALYSRITPSLPAEKPSGEWQKLDITLCKRHVTVILNGKTIIDNQPAFGPTGGAISSDVFAPGPLYLQGDHGKVSYRNLVLTPIIK